jgi:pyridoxal phosphate enzyme (YggS family)
VIGVTENLRKIRDLLTESTSDAGRDPGSVTLLAVTKKQPLGKIREAADAGQRDFGENSVQEALPKVAKLSGEDLVWHFVGRLQSNKTRAVAEHFDWVHSIDRLKLAERLNEQRPDGKPPLNVLIQVNVDHEDSKAGISPVDLPDLAKAVSEMPRLALRGLMCIPAVRGNFEEQRRPFRILRELSEFLAGKGIATDTLSMGMSNDYRAAIFEGATVVRIGTAIFGERK